MKRVAVALAGALVASGCGGAAESPPASAPAEVPVTAQALAAVAAEHAGSPSAAGPEDWAGYLRRSVSTELRYGSTGEYDGDVLVLAVGTGLRDGAFDCGGTRLDGCARDERGLLLWQEVEPEEDPGYVAVVVEGPDEVAVVLQAGEDITGDPRQVDLAVSVGDMFALAGDERVGLTTTQDAVDAGAALEYWRG